jgi:hypothetical protein
LDPVGGFLLVVMGLETLAATEAVAEGGGGGVTVTVSVAGAAAGTADTLDVPDTGGAAAVGSATPASPIEGGRDKTVNVTAAMTLTPSMAASPTNHLLVARAGAGSCAERATACTLVIVPTAAGSGVGAPGSDATNVAPSPKLGELSGRGVVGGVCRLERGAEKPGALIG